MIAAFEDGGYFCVDNLPPRMIESPGDLFRHEDRLRSYEIAMEATKSLGA